MESVANLRPSWQTKIQKYHIVLPKLSVDNVTDVTFGLRNLKWQAK